MHIRRWMGRQEPNSPVQPSTPARTVLVTGGAKGIGAAVVRHFAANGDTVVIADRDRTAATELARSLGGEHVAKTVNLNVESDVVALFDELRGRFGRLEVLVNSAVVADMSAVDQMLPAQTEHVLDVTPVPSLARVRRSR